MNENKKPTKANTYSITASTIPTKLATKNPDRAGLFAKNTGSVTAYVTSSQNKAYTEGTDVEAKATFEDTLSGAEWWIITASSSATIKVIEVGY